MVSNLLQIQIDTQNIKFNDLVLPIQKYFDGKNIFIDENFSIGDKEYHIYFNYGLDSLLVDIQISLLNVDDDAVGYFLNMSKFLEKFSFFDYFKKYVYLDDLNSIKDYIGSIESNISFSKGDIVGKINEVEGLINVSKSDIIDILNDLKVDVDVDVDLTPILNKLNEIEIKFDFTKVIELPTILEQKVSKYLGMQSLNGSNGSKFADGSVVNVKGYQGNWIVEGSYPMLNQDSVSIVVYKLVQDGKILLAPAPFVTKVS